MDRELLRHAYEGGEDGMTTEQVEKVISALIARLGEGTDAAVRLGCNRKQLAEEIAQEVRRG